MSTHLKEKEEKIRQILERLADEATKGSLIVVEGKKDIETLASLGVCGKVLSAKSGGRSLLNVVSEIKGMEARKVILLPDFDRRGKELLAQLKRFLEHEGIAPDTVLWAELFSLVGKEVKDVEGLASYMETLKSKLSGNSQT